MKVAFDAICLADGPVTGVARAFLTGLTQYSERFGDDMIVLVPDDAHGSELPDVRTVAAPRGAWRRQRGIPRLLRDLGAAVLHSSVAAVPLRAPCPTIATVHDLPWLHPEAGERSTWWRRFATTRALRSAALVIAPSRFTLAAAARLLGTERTLRLVPHVTPPAPARAAAPPRNGPFVTFGDDRPRKNRDRVRQAHAIARRADPTLPDLRFVGPPDDYVTEAEKAELLATCRAVVQCSLYEGFGLPVLEALVHGAPLICSDIPPHREIATGAATFVEPTAIDAIAAALGAPPASTAPRPPADIVSRWRELHTAAS